MGNGNIIVLALCSLVTALVATGEISGTAILTLAGGNILTLRNNSATPLVMTLAPGVGSQFNAILLS